MTKCFHVDRCALVLGPGCQLGFSLPLWSQDRHVTFNSIPSGPRTRMKKCFYIWSVSSGPRTKTSTWFFSSPVVPGPTWHAQFHVFGCKDPGANFFLHMVSALWSWDHDVNLFFFFPCGPRTDMARSIPSLLVLRPRWHDVFTYDRCALLLGPWC